MQEECREAQRRGQTAEVKTSLNRCHTRRFSDVCRESSDEIKFWPSSSDQRHHSRILIAAACQTERYRYPGCCNVTDRYRYRSGVGTFLPTPTLTPTPTKTNFDSDSTTPTPQPWLQELVGFYQQNSLKDCFKLLDTMLQFPYKEPEKRENIKLAEQRVKYLGSARARYDFCARDRTELTLKEGDVIRILNKKGHQGWWKGEVYGKIGWFPSNYVEDDFSEYC
ncbi:unnamed protein product [Ranitomeya imitator]|uniref:SH3 domain-containing protein n=1 Tax=Ranitomeya imitator TaxID=111125 RepID=A0ABN9MD25_9NEOB|nr:unnamed protein product [Ranitomeya imitator]